MPLLGKSRRVLGLKLWRPPDTICSFIAVWYHTLIYLTGVITLWYTVRFSITLCYNSVPGSFGTIQSQTGIFCHAMGQCRYVHLFHGLNSTSISCDLNQKQTHTSVPWSEQSTLDFCAMWLESDTDIEVECYSDCVLTTEIDTLYCHGFECFPRRTVFSLVIGTHTDTTLHLPFNNIWYVHETNLNLDIGTNCRYIPSKWWWNIDFNPLNFPAGWDCHSGNCLSSVDVQLLLSSGQPGTTVHWVHGGTLIIIMQ